MRRFLQCVRVRWKKCALSMDFVIVVPTSFFFFVVVIVVPFFTLKLCTPHM